MHVMSCLDRGMEGGEDDEEEGLYLRLTEETARSIKLNQRNEAAGQRGGDEQGRAGTLLSYLEPIQQGETIQLPRPTHLSQKLYK